MVKLGDSARQRREMGLALLEGVHLAQEYLVSGGVAAHWIVSESGIKNAEVLALLARHPEVKPVVFTDDLMVHCTTVDEPQGIAAVIPIPIVSTLPVTGSCLVLESLQDPGNLGTLIRSAAASGLEAVVCSKGTAHLWSPKVLRASQGAHFKVRLYEGVNLPLWLKGYDGRVVAAVGGAPAHCFGADLTGNVALLVGNEGAGLSAELQQLATLRVSIPMIHGVESLNAAVAGSVLMFERLRQSGFAT
jgi:TrmH family RNA methyltransferase